MVIVKIHIDSFIKKQLLRCLVIMLAFASLSSVFGNWHSVFADDYDITIFTFEEGGVGVGQERTYSITHDDPAGVTCSVVEPGGGSVDQTDDLEYPNCTYTAPATPGVYHIRATSNTDALVYAELEVEVNAIFVTLTDPSVVATGGSTSINFSTNGGDLTWEVVEVGGGSVNSGGGYTAPATPGTYHVTATSVYDPSATDTAEVTVIEVEVSLTPSTITLPARNQTTLTATTNPESALIWSIVEGNDKGYLYRPGMEIDEYDNYLSEIAGDGEYERFYVAPTVPGVYHVRVQSQLDNTKFATSTITVTSAPVTVTPSTFTIYSGQSTSTGLTSDSEGAVWSSDDFEIIGATASGSPIFTAPSEGGAYYIRAGESDNESQYGGAMVIVQQSTITIEISPSSAVTTLGNNTVQFTADVSGVENTDVEWSIISVCAISDPLFADGCRPAGIIDQNGLYTASNGIGTDLVCALSVVDPSQGSCVEVTVSEGITYSNQTSSGSRASSKKETSLIPSLGASSTPPVASTSVLVVPKAPIKKNTTNATRSATSSVATSTMGGLVATSTSLVQTDTRTTLTAVTDGVSRAVENTATALKTPEISLVVNTITTAGAVAGVSSWSLASLVINPLFTSPIAMSEVLFIPFRLWGLTLSFLGIRRRNRPWGTVYDSVTKMPIDPAVVTLYDADGKKVATSITDLDGRFGFMVKKGTYTLLVQKTNYAFPSKKLGQKQSDELYSNLYFGEKIVVVEDGSVIYKNIPLDPKKFDWNEFTKNKMGVMQYHSLSEKFNAKIGPAIFWIGFVVGIITTIVVPHPYTITILSFYVAMIVLRFSGVHRKAFGTVTDSANHPLSFAAISVFSKDLHRELFKKVADQYGRYYVLVPKGEYEIKVSKKNADESYVDVYKGTVLAKNGVINSSIKV